MSIFIRNLNAAGKAEAMATVPQERVDAILDRTLLALPGVRVSGMDLPEALRAAGADFQVGLRPVMAVLSADQAVEVPFARATVNETTGAPLGCVGTGYGVIQTADWLSGAYHLAQAGAFAPQTVAMVDGGKRISVYGLLGASEIPRLGRAEADVLAHLGIWTVSHDGSASASASLYTINLVCLNGMTTQAAAGRVTLRHSTNAEGRIAAAQDALLGLRSASEEEASLFAEMGGERFTAAEHRAFCAALLDEVRGPLGEDPTVRRELRRERELAELETLFGEGEGNVGASKLDSYNAVTEWLTVRRARYAEGARFAKAWESQREGDKATTRARALRLLVRR